MKPCFCHAHKYPDNTLAHDLPMQTMEEEGYSTKTIKTSFNAVCKDDNFKHRVGLLVRAFTQLKWEVLEFVNVSQFG
jgi:hypothetical protein